jgi:putative ABC transport system permease protein
MNIEPEQGRMLNKNDRKKIVLGYDFTDENRYSKKIKIGTKLEIEEETFEVIGILKRAGTFQINSVILMSDADLRNILKIGDEIDIIVVQVKNQDELNKVAEDIAKALRNDRGLKEGKEDFSIQTPQQALQSINTILLILQIVVTGIAAISLVVGGIGIANTMYTSVLERTKEIGIMKAVGAQNKDILLIFLTESAVLGFVGGVIGSVIGLTFAYLVSFGVRIAVQGINFNVTLSPYLLLGSLLFSLVVGIISGIMPAIQASRLHPVEALRK